MAATAAQPMTTQYEDRVVIDDLDWDRYVAISDAVPDRHNPRLIYVDGSLTLVTISRRHDWLAERLGNLVMAVASGLGIVWDDAGSATFRLRQRRVGVEGDKTYYFGEHAEQMHGIGEIDMTAQPPPDLVVEVEVSHPADKAVIAWAAIGVPEVWRFDESTGTVTFLVRRDDGSYAPADRSAGLPPLTPADVAEQLRLADSLGSSRWFQQLGPWARDIATQRPGDA